jgi:hypothetical protein
MQGRLPRGWAGGAPEKTGAPCPAPAPALRWKPRPGVKEMRKLERTLKDVSNQTRFLQLQPSLSSRLLPSSRSWQISSSGRFSFVTSAKGGDYIFFFQNMHNTQLHRMSMTLKHRVTELMPLI